MKKTFFRKSLNYSLKKQTDYTNFNERNENVSGYIYDEIQLVDESDNPNNVYLTATKTKEGKTVKVIINEQGQEIIPIQN